MTPGSFWNSVSIAAWPLAVSPKVGAAPTIAGSPSSIPKPFKNPSWRSWPTLIPGARSNSAILGSIPISATLALAYWPISSPALKLSVANNASTADSGSVGVSSAITITPAARAFSIAGTTALESAGTSKIPFAPWVVMFSNVVTCDALSVSDLPDAVSSLTFSLPAASAPSFIFTKNGLASVLAINPTVTSSSPPPRRPTPPPSPSSPPTRSDPAHRERQRGAERRQAHVLEAMCIVLQKG